MESQENREEIYFVKILVVLLVALLILTFTFIASYRNSQKQSYAPIFPGGVTYLGLSPTLSP